MNRFKGRSLCVIDDFSKEERLYLFRKVRELKKAIKDGDDEKRDSFRINDPDFGIYEVFLEDSTRTKESFRNAAEFHHAKLTEMSTDNSSFNKGESYSDTSLQCLSMQETESMSTLPRNFLTNTPSLKITTGTQITSI